MPFIILMLLITLLCVHLKYCPLPTSSKLLLNKVTTEQYKFSQLVTFLFDILFIPLSGANTKNLNIIKPSLEEKIWFLYRFILFYKPTKKPLLKKVDLINIKKDLKMVRSNSIIGKTDGKEEEYEASIEETEEKGVTKLDIKELVGTMRPVILTEMLFGIFRFRLHNSEVLPANGKMKILFFIMAFAYIFIFFYLRKISDAITGTSKLADIVDEMPPVVVLIEYILSAIRTSYLLNEKNIQIVKTLADLDCKLHINTNKEFYKKSHTVAKRTISAIILAHIGLSVCDVVTDGRINLSTIIVFPIYVQQSLEISVFCMMILTLRRRLQVINNYLAKFIDEKDSEKSSVFIVAEKKEGPKEFNLIGRSSSDNMKIRDLAVTYDIVGETCSLISDVFNFQIFMTLVATFTYIVCTIWLSLYVFKTSVAKDNNMSLATIIIWCITDICIVAFMSLTCEKLLLTRTDTKILVNKIIMDYDLPKGMRVQAKAFMELIEAWPLRIFIYDMFSVDITLMLKYISVATTYLIVIIQISHFTYT